MTACLPVAFGSCADNRCIRVLGFFATEMDFVAKSAKLRKKLDRKARSEKAFFTFNRDP